MIWGIVIFEIVGLVAVNFLINELIEVSYGFEKDDQKRIKRTNG